MGLTSVALFCAAAQFAAACGTTVVPTPKSTPSVAASTVPTAPSQAITAQARPAAAPIDPVVLGYFTNWAHHRPAPCDFKTQDVDASLFTHINYSFGLVEASKDKESYALVPSSDEDIPRLYAEVQGLKKANPALKTFIAVGGWAFNDKPTEWIFSAMAETKERRGSFIRQAIAFAREHGFDGVDIDWEFPGVSERGGRAQDSENFTSLLREFRAQMQVEASESGMDELLLTIAAPAGHYFFQHQELGELHQWLNWINLMTYDYHGSWEMKTGANAPLKGEPLSIENSIAAYQQLGVPAEKIVLGMATYARGWSGVAEAKNGVIATGTMPDGPCGKESLAAYQVEDMIAAGKFERSWDPVSLTPIAYNAETNVYLTYDDKESIALKLDYLKQEKLAGAMFWAIDMDDFKKGFPMISQVSESLRGESASTE